MQRRSQTHGDFHAAHALQPEHAQGRSGSVLEHPTVLTGIPTHKVVRDRPQPFSAVPNSFPLCFLNVEPDGSTVELLNFRRSAIIQIYKAKLNSRFELNRKFADDMKGPG